MKARNLNLTKIRRTSFLLKIKYLWDLISDLYLKLIGKDWDKLENNNNLIEKMIILKDQILTILQISIIKYQLYQIHIGMENMISKKKRTRHNFWCKLRNWKNFRFNQKTMNLKEKIFKIKLLNRMLLLLSFLKLKKSRIMLLLQLLISLFLLQEIIFSIILWMLDHRNRILRKR